MPAAIREGRLAARLATLALIAALGMGGMALAPAAALAAEPVVAFETTAQRERYDRLLEEYRCLKCQNQNLAGSNAALAGDLRREIRDQIVTGSDDAAIDRYLVERYGDFVRYRPRFGGLNLILWVGPFVLLGIGMISGVVLARRSQGRALTGAAVDESDVARARALLQAQPDDIRNS